MRPSTWTRSPRGLFALFLATGVLLVGSLAWLGWQLVRAEREVAAQHLLERRENAADLAASLLARALSQAEAQLDALVAAPADGLEQHANRLGDALPGDCVLLVGERGRLQAYPRRRLPYLPAPDRFSPPPDATLEQAALLEARAGDDRAIRELLQRARTSRDPWVRATALARLARIESRCGRYPEARAAYDKLSNAGDAPVETDGLPAALFAAQARLVVFSRQGDPQAAVHDAGLIAEGLRHRRWRVARGVYEFYGGQAQAFLGASAAPIDPPRILAVAAVATALSEAGALTARRTAADSGFTFLVVSRAGATRHAALILGSDWLSGQLRETGRPLVGPDVLITITAPDGSLMSGPSLASPRRQTVRLTSTTGLPFNVQAVGAGGSKELRSADLQQRLLITGLGSIAILVLAGISLIARAVSQELAATRLQSEFVGAVSHEFRTPLSSLCHLSELLEAGRVMSEADRAEDYAALVRESHRLRRLVEGLLNFGRMEAGAMHYRMETIDPVEHVRELVGEFRRDAASRHVEVDVDIHDDTPLVRADRSALACALWNLLDNAVKYSPDCRTVWVIVGADGQCAAISIRDCGVGIPRSEQERIFEKFVRASSAAGVVGAGVGLALVRHIVAAHGGRVSLQSAPGEGSTFTILLPAVASTVSTPDKEPVAPCPAS